MNNCNEELLNLYIDNELENPQKDILNNHLRECLICQNKLQELLKIKETMKEMATLKTSDKFEAGLKEKIIQNKKVSIKPSGFKWQQSLAYVAGMGFILLSFAVVSRIKGPNIKDSSPALANKKDAVEKVEIDSLENLNTNKFENDNLEMRVSGDSE